MKTIRKYDFIDALRGWAIVGVVMVHASLMAKPETQLLASVASNGEHGVQLFFVASALTLFLSMRSRGKDESSPTRNYAIRRFFRISPLFYLAIVFYTLTEGSGTDYWSPNGLESWHVAATFLFVHGWHPETINSVVPGGWTIAVEMTFYFFIPLLYGILRTIRRTLIFIIGSLCFSPLAGFGIKNFYAGFFPEAQYYLVENMELLWFFNQLPVFGFGILAYHVFLKVEHNPNRKDGRVFLAAAIFLMFAFLGIQSRLGLLESYVAYAIAFFCLATALYQYPNRIFVNRIICQVGKQSFSIYIVHFYLITVPYMYVNATFGLVGDAGFIAVFLVLLTTSFSVSYFTYRLVEKPGIRLGNRIIEALEEKGKKEGLVANTKSTT